MAQSIWVDFFAGWPSVMVRRGFLLLHIALMSLGLFACQQSESVAEEQPPIVPITSPAPADEVQKPSQRNFILITADTMRGDVASIDGGPAYTPTMAKMRERGWHFRRCYSTSMLTNPSHASIMTSLYSQDHGVYDNSSGIDASHTTLAEVFAAAGYETHAVIAFKHLDPHVSRLGQGFTSVSPAPDVEPDALKSVDRALNWLRARADSTKPFFMWLHIVDPHAPYESTAVDEDRKPLAPVHPMKTAKRTAPGFQRKHPWYKSVFDRYKTTELMQSRYTTEVELVDRGLEALLEGLKALNLEKNTGVVLTSDHGENLGERELFFHHGGLYDSTVHVPLLFHLPWEPGALESEALVQTVDIAPTLLKLSGLEIPEAMQGLELSTVANGSSAGRPHAFSEHLYGLLTAVRSPEHTLIVHNKTSTMFPNYRFKKGREEFLGDKSVPAPARRGLKKALADWRSGKLEVKSVKPESQDMESLRQLGYID